MPTILKKRGKKEIKNQTSKENKNLISNAFAQFSMPVLETIGREKEISEILGFLNRANFIVLAGKKFIGKTSVVCEVSKRSAQLFENIVYLNCLEWNEEELQSSFCNLLSTLKEDVVKVDFAHIAFLEVIKRKKILFIFDNIVENDNMFFNIVKNAYSFDEKDVQSKVIVVESYSTRSRSVFQNKPCYFEIPDISEPDVFLMGKKEGVLISNNEAKILINNYNGCPIYIQIVIEYCKNFFESNISKFLGSHMHSVGNIEKILQEQFDNLTSEAKDILHYIMLLNNNISVEELSWYLPVEKNKLFNIISMLFDLNFLCKISPTSIKLSLPIEEFVQKNFINKICDEIIKKTPEYLMRYPLLTNLATEEVKTYQRHIMMRITENLCSNHGVDIGDLGQILYTCDKYVEKTIVSKNFLTGNIINLLSVCSDSICNLSFANKYISNANLESIEMQNVDFTNAHFENCSFKNIFGSVTAMSYNRKLKLLATAFFNGLIIIWNKQGVQIAILMEFNNSVNDVVFVDDRLFACGKDGRIVEWSIDNHCNFEIIRELTVSKEPIRAISFISSYNYLFAGSEDGKVRRWELNKNIEADIICEKNYRIKSMAISPDEKSIAIGGDNEELTIYDTRSTQLQFSCNVDNRWIRCLDFYDNSTLICGGDLGKINIIDLSKKTVDTIENADKNKVWSVVSLPNCHSFIIGGDTGTLKVYSIKSKSVEYIMQKHSSWVRCLATADGYLFSGSEDQTICIWNLQNYKCQKVIRGYTKRVFSLDYSKDKLYAGLGDHSVVEIDINNNCTKQLFSCSDQVWTISSEGTMISAGCDKGDIYIYDLALCRMLYTCHFDSGWIGSVKFSPQGELLVVGDEFGTAYILNTKNKYIIAQTNKYKAHEGRIASLIFSKDIIVSVGEDGFISGFNYKKKKFDFKFKISNKLLYSIDKVNDNKYLAGGSDGKVYCIDTFLEKSDELIDIECPIWSIKVSSNQTFFVGTDNGALHEYSLDGVLLNKFDEHDNQIWTININESKNQLVTGGEDSRILIHRILPNVILEQSVICNLPYKNVLLRKCTGLSDMQKNYLCIMGAIE